MKTRQIVLRCEGGLHLRVAAKVVKEVSRHQSQVHIRCQNCPRANACSIFELLQLGAGPGTQLDIQADGPDEDSTLQALADVFETGGGI